MKTKAYGNFIKPSGKPLPLKPWVGFDVSLINREGDPVGSQHSIFGRSSGTICSIMINLHILKGNE